MPYVPLTEQDTWPSGTHFRHTYLQALPSFCSTYTVFLTVANGSGIAITGPSDTKELVTMSVKHIYQICLKNWLIGHIIYTPQFSQSIILEMKQVQYPFIKKRPLKHVKNLPCRELYLKYRPPWWSRWRMAALNTICNLISIWVGFLKDSHSRGRFSASRKTQGAAPPKHTCWYNCTPFASWSVRLDVISLFGRKPCRMQAPLQLFGKRRGLCLALAYQWKYFTKWFKSGVVIVSRLVYPTTKNTGEWWIMKWSVCLKGIYGK